MKMLFYITNSIIVLFDQIFWFVCDAVFWCFRFIEIIPKFFSIIFGTFKFVLSLNHALFSNIFSFMNCIKENCVLIIVGANELPSIIVDNVQELALFVGVSSKKGFSAISKAGKQSLLLCQQEIVNSVIFFKDFGCQIMSSFIQAIWGIITSIGNIFLESLRRFGLYLESHMNTIGKLLIHILIMKPLELIAYLGDIILAITANAATKTVNTFQWTYENLVILINVLYTALASCMTFLAYIIKIPFTFIIYTLKEHREYNYLLFTLGVFCIIGYLIAYNARKDNSQHVDGFECVVCLDRKKTVLLLPCQHLCLCPPCHNEIKRMISLHRKCPLCRQRIRDHINVYF